MKSVRHLNALRALEASIRLGSFRSAADELGVTPAAVGQQVRGLEATLGRQLLIRQANGFVPSELALSAAPQLATGFDALRSALSMLVQQDRRHRVHITVTPSIAERWLAPRLPTFLADHPRIDLRIDSTPYALYESGGEFDFTLRYDRAGFSGSGEAVLFGETLLPVCTPGVASQIGPIEHEDCLAGVPIIHVDRSTDDPDWQHWEEWGETSGYRIPEGRPGRLHFAYTTLALRSMYDGFGLHLAQLSVTLADISSGRLVAPFGVSRCVSPGYHYRLAWTAPDTINPLQRAFRDWVLGEAEATKLAMNDFLAG